MGGGLLLPCFLNIVALRALVKHLITTVSQTMSVSVMKSLNTSLSNKITFNPFVIFIPVLPLLVHKTPSTEQLGGHYLLIG